MENKELVKSTPNLFEQKQNTLLRVNFLEIEVKRLNEAQSILIIENKERQKENEYLKKSLESFIEKTSISNQSQKDYLGLGGIGALHSPPVGAVHLGLLLQKLDIAIINNRMTRPKAEYSKGKNPLAINKPTMNGYLAYFWHYDRTWKIINRKLKKLGLFTEFHSLLTKDDIHKFIKGIK